MRKPPTPDCHVFPHGRVSIPLLLRRCVSGGRGRNLREIEFDRGEGALAVGEFPAFDYFGDGSFYLLDSPGHAVGHLCGLARTTSNPDTFVLLGGDVCHYAGIFRPSKLLPMPDRIVPHPCRPAESGSVLCPGHAWEELQRSRGRETTDSLFDMTFGLDVPLATKTTGQLQELDCLDNVFVIIAHDSTVRDGVPHFPHSLNAWKEKGWGEALKWRFLRDLEPYWRSEGLP
jgi:glyoxylase-like metal-dependent hydrolase (beta-lactamase superfamily II)